MLDEWETSGFNRLRLAAGFVGAGFNEADGSTGTFGGAFVTLSEEWDE